MEKRKGMGASAMVIAEREEKPRGEGGGREERVRVECGVM